MSLIRSFSFTAVLPKRLYKTHTPCIHYHLRDKTHRSHHGLVLVKILPFSAFRLSPCFFIGVHRFLSASCFHSPLLNLLGCARGKYLIVQPRFYWLHFQGQYAVYFFPFVCSIFLVVFFALVVFVCDALLVIIFLHPLPGFQS